MVDLHIHSKASDGRLTVSELIVKAKRNGIETIAITDHDTVDGIRDYFSNDCIDPNINVVSGIELSTEDSGTLHVLGYRFNLNDNNLVKHLKMLDISYAVAIKKVCRYINNIYNTNIDPINNGRVMMKKRIADMLIERNVFETYSNAIELLDYRKYGVSPPLRLSAKKAINLIREANGIAVLAHPGRLLREVSEIDLINKMDELVQIGLQGIECFNPSHNQKQEELLIKYALERELYITAGSDFHGEKCDAIGAVSKYDLFHKYEDKLLFNKIL